jgi:16S rRNA (cytosine967-C5)-methyltransferase
VDRPEKPDRDEHSHHEARPDREFHRDRGNKGYRRMEERGRRDGGDRKPYSRQAPGERARRADPPRLAAFDLLRAVDDGAYANLTLPTMLTQRRIEGRDAAFATELAYGTTRMRGQYDAVIDRASGRGSDIDPAVRDALRMGVHQVASMRVPDHAAVAATVGVVREAVGIGPSQFVNAILRTITEGPYPVLLDEAAPDDGSLRSQSIRMSHPEWIIRTLKQALAASGRDPGDLQAVLEADNTHPLTTLVARPGLITTDQLAEQVEQRTKRAPDPGKWSPSALVMHRGTPGDLPAIRSGQAAVQDEGSQLVAWALAEAAVDDDSGAWLDLCAGPGGKAALLGAIGRERGAHLTANEPQHHRAELVRSTVAHLGDAVTVTEEDGRQVEGSFDRVLVDVPCTGLGALRRRPEARWRHSPRDLATLGPLQRELLDAALDRARPGGIVAYSTCSPHVAETRLVVQDVLGKRDDAEVIDASTLPILAATGAVGDDGMVQLWTDVQGTDSMFLALIRRR